MIYIFFPKIYSLVKPLYKQSIQIVTNEKEHIFVFFSFEQRILLYIEEINVLETFIVYLFIFFKIFLKKSVGYKKNSILENKITHH